METIQEYNEVSLLTSSQESWVNYWDRWLAAAMQVGDLNGIGHFLIMSIVAMNGGFEGTAPESTSVVHSFEHPGTFEDVYYSWI